MKFDKFSKKQNEKVVFDKEPRRNFTQENRSTRVQPKRLPVVEIFKSIQGEGLFAGAITYFVRFAGCDCKCKWCDEPSHKDPSVKLVATDVKSIMSHLSKAEANIVTLTGGNPCIHDLTPLIKALKIAGFKIHVETQGTILPMWLRDVDFITISPKGKTSGNVTDLFALQQKLRAFKYVRKQFKPVVSVYDSHVDLDDLKYAQDVVNMFKNYPIIIQMGDLEESVKDYGVRFNMLCDAILSRPQFKGVKVMPQVHKIGGVR